MCNLRSGLYLLLTGIFISLASIAGVSMLSYPTSTVLVTSGTIDLMAISSLTAALIAEKSIKLSCISLLFTSISTLQSGLFLLSSLLMDYRMMTKFLGDFGVQTKEFSPEILRLALFLSGIIWFTKAVCMLIGSCLLHRKNKKLGEVIMWSYNDQGLYIWKQFQIEHECQSVKLKWEWNEWYGIFSEYLFLNNYN